MGPSCRQIFQKGVKAGNFIFSSVSVLAAVSIVVPSITWRICVLPEAPNIFYCMAIIRVTIKEHPEQSCMPFFTIS